VASLEQQKEYNPKVLEIMAQNGVMIGEMRVVDFFYFTKNKTAARQLREDLVAAGFNTDLAKQGWFRPTWTVSGKARVQATVEHLNAFCERMWKYGDARGIEFDGWGAEV